MKKTHWKLDKARAMYINRRQWERDFDPLVSSEAEITTESGVYLITETSDPVTPTFYVTE